MPGSLFPKSKPWASLRERLSKARLRGQKWDYVGVSTSPYCLRNLCMQTICSLLSLFVISGKVADLNAIEARLIGIVEAQQDECSQLHKATQA